MSEPRQGPELMAWGRGQWVTPSPSTDGRAHLFRACVPPCMALRRALVWRWRGHLVLGCERCRVGSICWVHSTASESEAWFPRPLALWLLGSVGPETCGPHGCRKQHLRLPFCPRAPPSHSPALGSGAGKVGCACIPASWRKAFHLRQALPAPCVSPSLSELQRVTRPSALQQRLAVVGLASLGGGRFTVGLDDAYVCVCTCMHMSVHLCAHVYTHTHVCICTCTHTPVHTVHLCMCMCACTHVHICTYMYMSVHVCACLYPFPCGRKECFCWHSYFEAN